ACTSGFGKVTAGRTTGIIPASGDGSTESGSCCSGAESTVDSASASVLASCPLYSSLATYALPSSKNPGPKLPGNCGSYWTRTSDLSRVKRTLYPAELRIRNVNTV